MNLTDLLRNGYKPQDIVMNYLTTQAGNTPIGKNLLELIKKKDGKGIEQIARNMANARGVDFDKEFTAFRQRFSL